MGALEYLMLEVEKHSIMRAHSTLIMDAREELAMIKKDLAEYKDAGSTKDPAFLCVISNS